MNASGLGLQGLGAFAAALLLGAAASSGPPAGWRQPTADEAADFARNSRESGNPAPQVLPVGADFDGDGQDDRAEILLSSKGGRFQLFVVRARNGRYEALGEPGDVTSLQNVTLSVVPPGRHETHCGRGGGDANAPCHRVIRNRWPAIDLAHQEASDQVFWWDGRKFDREWLTD
jgi:hypothetical protein